MADYPKRLYHPDLGREIEAADAGQEAVYAESGWIEVDEPPEPLPGYQAEPTRYVQGDDGKFHPSHLMESKGLSERVKSVIEADAAGAVEAIENLGKAIENQGKSKPRRKPAAKPADEDS